MSLGPDFQTILAAAKCGAESAWAAIYRDLAGPVKGYFATRGAAEPEDLAAEVFLQAARDLCNFHGDEANFRSWVFVIAHRRLVDSWRATGRRATQIPLSEFLGDPLGGDVEQEALDRLVGDELLAAFSGLTDDQRAVVALRVIGGLSLEQTARVLDRRAGAVKALQRRALAALRDALPERE